ncbi:Protein of unknown function (DUF3478) [Thioflavicoccus mobilis 8321]|uniref:STAS/SEC14 domain-containing protein n=1 Tax=Thioflavicoccus mobilis 8321 TaxID=765912 RepID=L0GYF4_9GAMM|nr:STAS/SEC14 domain-containing protein [Thioflavicoccus mobilis]AGA90857.1 Protein of unknown function (DUF3478) [Thioflavicoccus mobilis 8321]
MIEQIQTGSPAILAFRLSGKLHDQDYRTFVPVIENAIAAAPGPVRLLVELIDFHGWDPKAAWDDFKLGIRHYADFERMALIGDKDWEAWMGQLAKPFTRATVRHFDAAEADAAWAWIREGT